MILVRHLIAVANSENAIVLKSIQETFYLHEMYDGIYYDK